MNIQQKEVSKRIERAHHILDAASALILRWGYNKTTVDDIAIHAGVAKGTIYLHWKTREALFTALIIREKLLSVEDIIQRLKSDASGLTLGMIAKHSVLAVMKRPLLKALLFRDREILGKLAQGEISGNAFAERLVSFKTVLDLLREHGLVRTDLSMKAEMFIWSSILAGFFLVTPLVPPEFSFPDEEIAGMMSETVHRTLETERTLTPDELQTITGLYVEQLNRLIAVEKERFQKELEL